MRKVLSILITAIITTTVVAQRAANRADSERWQQYAKYTMEIDMNV